jgi:predicted AlkP superfamily phosphohydrolase/phosphomutase
MHMLAIGLDAAEPWLVRKLIEQGQMPALKSLLDQGKWMRMGSTAFIGSGSVWPTFITGEDPGVHGVYGEWLWHPETMDITRYRGNNLAPFWKQLADKGVSLGILDVPFMPLIGLDDGFEISEWGPHDVVEGKTQIGPHHVAGLIAKEYRHPIWLGTSVAGPHDHPNLKKLGEACLTGIRLRGAIAKKLLVQTRPQLAMIGFTEIHRSAHYLWHTAEPEHPIYRNNGIAKLGITRPTIEEIYIEVDRQIGELVKLVGDKTPVMVFSLHGMRPAHGAPGFLTPLLCEMGFARLADWSDQSWCERSRSLMAKVKRYMPAGLKKLYYMIASPGTAHRLARPNMLPLYDWSHTQAFALPTDQHGWIRINLKGREAKGIVPLAHYEEICRELAERLRSLTTDDGRPLVKDVMRPPHAEDALRQPLPDLIIHWEDAVFASPLRIRGSAVKTEAVGRKYVGQHSLEGFCILRGTFGVADQEVLQGKDLHKLMINLLVMPADNSSGQPGLPTDNERQAEGAKA